MIEKIKGWENTLDIDATLEPGPQCCKITKIVNVPENQYIRVEFDIIKGPLTGFFQSLSESRDDHKWSGFINEFYTEKSIKFFKAFITAVEKSNKNYKWDWDETKLVNKYVVVNFREEEYINKDKELAVYVAPFEFRSAEALNNGKIKIAPKRVLSEEDKKKLGYVPNVDTTMPATPIDIPDDDLPF